MAYQLEELLPHIEKRQQEERLKNFEQIRHQMGVGVAMSELQADPRWAIYGNHLKAIQEEHERSAKGYELGLVGGEYLTPRRYGEMKVKLAESKGIIKGIQIALELAKTLVERGNLATDVSVGMNQDSDNKDSS